MKSFRLNTSPVPHCLASSPEAAVTLAANVKEVGSQLVSQSLRREPEAGGGARAARHAAFSLTPLPTTWPLTCNPFSLLDVGFKGGSVRMRGCCSGATCSTW